MNKHIQTSLSLFLKSDNKRSFGEISNPEEIPNVTIHQVKQFKNVENNILNLQSDSKETLISLSRSGEKVSHGPRDTSELISSKLGSSLETIDRSSLEDFESHKVMRIIHLGENINPVASSNPNNEEEKAEETSIISKETASKKRGNYKRSVNKKTGKDSFLEEYVESADSIYSSWIKYDKDLDKLFCRICIKANEKKQNIWGDPTRGCGSFRKDTCDQHLTTLAHKKSQQFKDTIEAIPSLETFIQKQPVSSVIIQDSGTEFASQLYQEYHNIFNNVYWCCKEELSILKIPSLHDYTKNKLQIDVPNYHLSIKSSTLFLDIISRVIRQNLLEEISQSDNIGILIDESTDVSQHQILLLYIRYFSSKEKKISERFCKAFELEKANAETIYEKLKSF